MDDEQNYIALNPGKNAHRLLLVCFVSGNILFLPPSWSLLYKINLFFHPLVSLIVAIWLLKNVGASLRPLWKENRASRIRKWGMVIVLTAAFFAGWYKLAPSPRLTAAYWVILISLWIWRRSLVLKVDALLSISVGWYVLAALSGLIFMAGGGGRKLIVFLLLHRLSSLLMLAGYAGLVFRQRRRGPGAWRKTGRRALQIGWPALLLLVVMAADSYASLPKLANRLHLSTLPLEKRTADEQDRIAQGGPRYRRYVEKIDSCGKVPGCHPAIVDDHRISAHNIALRTHHFQKNLRLLEDEIGERNIPICAGCHYPGLLFDPQTKVQSYYEADDMGCTFCHQFTGVEFPQDPRKTFVTLKFQTNHLAMFDRDEKDAISGWNRLLINLNPTGHGAVFTKKLYRQDEFCQACHRLQIRQQVEKVFAKPRCADCHMQPRYVIGEEGRQRNHFFPGANLALFTTANVPKGYEITERYAMGDLPLTLKGWGSFWELRDRTHGDKSVWLQMRIMPADDPRAGQPFRFSIITLNAGIDHPFPAAPLDLIDVWQSVVVKDANGRALLTIGELQEDFSADPAAHRLGGIMMGLDGKPVERNRVWQIKSKTIQRDIPFHTDTVDEYTLDLPADVAGPLEISAWWNYRKLNQRFVDWAYGTWNLLPILRIAEIRATVPIPSPQTDPPQN